MLSLQSYETSQAFVDALLPMRDREAHKGDFGKILLLCGSTGFTGAAALAAGAALRTGSGLIFLGVPEGAYPILDVYKRQGGRSGVIYGFLRQLQQVAADISGGTIVLHRVPAAVEADDISLFSRGKLTDQITVRGGGGTQIDRGGIDLSVAKLHILSFLEGDVLCAHVADVQIDVYKRQVYGGVTTLIDFADQIKGGNIEDSLEQRLAYARAQ